MYDGKPATIEQVEELIIGQQLLDLAEKHAEWSRATFGEDHERGPVGALRHLQAEAGEVIEAYEGLQRLMRIEAPVAHTDHLRKVQADKVATEFSDLLLLFLDGSRRAGLNPLDIIQAAHAKLKVLKTRVYLKTPDGVPSMHVRPGRGGNWLSRQIRHAVSGLAWLNDLPLFVRVMSIISVVVVATAYIIGRIVHQ